MNIFCYARVTVERMNTKCCYAQDNWSIETSIAIYMNYKQLWLLPLSSNTVCQFDHAFEF